MKNFFKALAVLLCVGLVGFGQITAPTAQNVILGGGGTSPGGGTVNSVAINGFTNIGTSANPQFAVTGPYDHGVLVTDVYGGINPVPLEITNAGALTITFATCGAYVSGQNGVGYITVAAGGTNQNVVLTPSGSGVVTSGGASLSVTAPTNGVGAWGLGTLRTGTGLVFDTTRSVEITINGTRYDLALITTTP